MWALGGRTLVRGHAVRQRRDLRSGAPTPGDRHAAARGRGGLAAAALADRVLVFGGEAPLRIFNATEMYEVAGHRWIAKEPMPTPRHGIGAAVIGGRVYVPGRRHAARLRRHRRANEAYTP